MTFGHVQPTKAARAWRAVIPSAIAVVVAAAASVVASERDAEAQAVLFISVGEPSKDTVRLLAPYLDEMAHHEFAVALPKDFRARLGKRAPRPGRADPGMQVSDLVMRYEDRLAHFRRNQWKEAAAKLSTAIEIAHENAALLADETSHRETWIKGLIALAMSRHRLRDEAGAVEANEDLVRTYPNQVATIQALSGSEAARHYATAQTHLEARGRGRLIVEAREQTARVYLDADDRPPNGILEAEVLPGLHRVLIRMPGTDGQLYDAVVEPGKTTRLSVDLAFGEILSMTDRYAGLVFPMQVDRDRLMMDYATQLATAVYRGPEMILVERVAWRGQPAFKSVMYLADSGAWVRGRVVALDGRNDDDRMRALAREMFHAYVQDRRVVDLIDPALRSLAPTHRAWLTWTAAGGAVALFATGASLWYLHQTCGPNTDPCRSESPTLAYASLGAGAMLGLVATYLHFSDRSSHDVPLVSLQPTTGGVLLGLSGTY